MEARQDEIRKLEDERRQLEEANVVSRILNIAS